MLLKPGIYTPSRFTLEVHVDEYGTERWLMTATVQGEKRSIELAVRESKEGAILKAAKGKAVLVLIAKLHQESAAQAVRAAEANDGVDVWLRYYDPETNIFQTYQLSDDINYWLDNQKWPEV